MKSRPRVVILAKGEGRSPYKESVRAPANYRPYPGGAMQDAGYGLPRTPYCQAIP
jgi:hypothetical protein